MELTVVGHLSRDLIITPETRREAIGGGTAYAMLAPSIGARTRIVSKVGHDFEEKYLNVLQDSGLNLSALHRTSGQTTRFVNRYDSEGNRSQSVEAVAPDITGADVDEEDVSGTIVHCCPLLGEVDMSLLRKAAQHASFVSLDIQGYLRQIHEKEVQLTDWDDKEEILPFVDLVKADERELQYATGILEEEQVAEHIMELGPCILLVTRNRRGSTIYTPTEKVDIPAIPAKKIVDVTGCGDTYSIGFLVEYSQTGDLYSSGVFAAGCASFNLETIGPYGMPSRHDVETRIVEYL